MPQIVPFGRSPNDLSRLFRQHQIKRAKQAINMLGTRALAHEADAPDLPRERTKPRTDLDAMIQ